MANKLPEILAPVGNYEMLQAAINAKADAIYFGIKGINMRANAKNFNSTDLRKIAKLCHDNNIRAYLTLNTIIYQHEILKIKSIITQAKKAGIDAIICWDFAVIKEAKKQNMEIHISTQASVSNYDSLEFFYKQGARRVVFARELTLEEIKKIRTKIKKNKLNMKIEVFAHGAMCVSESGRCFMSEHLYGKSANRGECIQPCRRSYIITDPETKKELKIENNYIMSPKDLAILPFLDKIVSSVDSLKLEGRGRSPEYVKVIVEVYREALESISKKKYTDKLKEKLFTKIATVYNRGFSNGFYMNRPITDFTNAYGSKATKTKTYVGYVKNYYKKAKAAEIKVEAKDLKINDVILIIGPTTGVYEQKINSMQIENKDVQSISKGKSIGIIINKLVRKNDKVYLWK